MIQFSSWKEVLDYARKGEPLYYQAPLDYKPVRIYPGAKKALGYEVRTRTIRIWPSGSIGRGRSRTADPFNADAGHLSRFLRPEVHKSGEEIQKEAWLRGGPPLPPSLEGKKHEAGKNPATPRRSKKGAARRYYVVEQAQSGQWMQVGHFFAKADAERFQKRLVGKSRIVRTFPSAHDYPVLVSSAPPGPASGFGREKTREDYMRRIAWEHWAATEQRRLGHEAIAGGHDLSRLAYERELTKKFAYEQDPAKKHERGGNPRTTSKKAAPAPAARKHPKTLRSGAYLATLAETSEQGATWKITRNGREVGALYDGPAYGWGRPRFSMARLAWSGPVPTGYPKNPDAALAFDGGPFGSHQEALDRFARQADALIAWRKAHGHESGKNPRVAPKKIARTVARAKRVIRKGEQAPAARVSAGMRSRISNILGRR